MKAIIYCTWQAILVCDLSIYRDATFGLLLRPNTRLRLTGARARDSGFTDNSTQCVHSISRGISRAVNDHSLLKARPTRRTSLISIIRHRVRQISDEIITPSIVCRNVPRTGRNRFERHDCRTWKPTGIRSAAPRVSFGYCSSAEIKTWPRQCLAPLVSSRRAPAAPSVRRRTFAVGNIAGLLPRPASK